MGKLATGIRERLVVEVLDKFKGTRSIDCRIYKVVTDGELMATTEGVTISPDQVGSLVELLREAMKKAKEKETNGDNQ
ncbi:MAG TPA: PC4/YdbC family ssDNA-binding protein [Syntrophorhabdaceae bacterium]|nr:PC4/YdbC family ssDNA-binding protein [Syntrophorhabdaceae bacterium]